MMRPLRISGNGEGQCAVGVKTKTSLTSGNSSNTDSCLFSSRTEIAGLGGQLGRQSEVTA